VRLANAERGGGRRPVREADPWMRWYGKEPVVQPQDGAWVLHERVQVWLLRHSGGYRLVVVASVGFCCRRNAAFGAGSGAAGWLVRLRRLSFARTAKAWMVRLRGPW